MLAQLAQGHSRRQVTLHQRAHGRRDEDLATAAGARDARCPMHVEPDIGAAAEQPLPGMQPHSHADPGALRPRLGGEAALGIDGGGEGLRRAVEDDEKRVTLGQDLGAVMGLPGASPDLTMTLQERRPTGPQRLRQARRALDVGEQERDGSGRELGHAGKYAGRRRGGKSRVRRPSSVRYPAAR